MKKLNRKGFTLIELLAVIVILAVIMVIATTSVLNTMNTSRKKSLLDSAQSAARAFDTAYAENALIGGSTVFGLTVGSTAVDFNGVEENKLNINSTDYDYDSSYVWFDGNKFFVCFTASEGKAFYVGDAVSTANSSPVTGVTLASGSMWACSDGTHSWTD